MFACFLLFIKKTYQPVPCFGLDGASEMCVSLGVLCRSILKQSTVALLPIKYDLYIMVKPVLYNKRS